MRFRDADDPELGRWVTQQRTSNRKQKLPKHRTEKLEEIGFVWSVRDVVHSSNQTYEKLWEEMYEKAKDFYEQHGHFSVSYDDDARLCQWVWAQQAKHRDGEMRSDRKEMLEAINFVWGDAKADRSQRLWYESFEKLREFQLENGHTCIRESDDFPLKGWSNKMEHEKIQGILSQE